MNEITNALYAEIDRLRARVKELEAERDADHEAALAERDAEIAALKGKYRLALADLVKDTVRKQELGIEIEHLKDEREGYRNGQQQVQAMLESTMDSNSKWAAENKALKAELADARLEIDKRDHWIKARDTLLAEARREVERLRDALDTIEGLSTDTTTDIQGVAKAALAGREGNDGSN